ncbi:MAG: apolipoprotein N-acyltransferase [Bacteroidetes bacterium]|nr:apolipoprotein N-acyltransferase [Bacteroidota bacterium]MBU1719331.1 apolipoprotein N-acyltransferase [Bacteroidota bacterium]
MKKRLILLALLSGVMLWAAWPVNGFAPLLFVAFIPMLFVEDYIHQNREKFGRVGLFNRAYLAFFVWNILTTWWIYYASFFGAAMAIIFNALFMALVFQLFHSTRKYLTDTQSYAALITYWIAWEYIHLDWDLTWPWFTFGNGFASWTGMIQWYEFTGTFGGSLWVLLVNVLIYRLIKHYFIDIAPKNKKFYLRVLGISMLIIIPVVISKIIYSNYTEKYDPRQIVVVQPNIDPYNEKFGGMSFTDQMNRILALADQKVSTETDFIVAPETAIPHGVWENDMSNIWSFDTIRGFISRSKKLKVVIGMTSRRVFEEGETISSTARKFKNEEIYYDEYNTALFLDNYNSIQLYHKSKLVPGVEKMPFPALFKQIESFAIDMGGTVGSLGTQDERSVFVPLDDSAKIAPVICYESIYGEFVAKYVRNGAAFIFIITNDGWWDDTPGYKQHCELARLRAIETRRSIARAANTGISCFIDQRGDVFLRTKWWEPAVINMDINANYAITFYVAHGDYIARICLMLSAILLLYSIILRIERRLGRSRTRNRSPQ